MGDAIALLGDAIVLLGDAIVFMGDAIVLPGDAIVLLGDAIVLLGEGVSYSATLSLSFQTRFGCTGKGSLSLSISSGCCDIGINFQFYGLSVSYFKANLNAKISPRKFMAAISTEIPILNQKKSLPKNGKEFLTSNV